MQLEQFLLLFRNLTHHVKLCFRFLLKYMLTWAADIFKSVLLKHEPVHDLLLDVFPGIIPCTTGGTQKAALGKTLL